MNTAHAINSDGRYRTYKPTFDSGDSETRAFANDSRSFIEGGFTGNAGGISISYNPKIVTKHAIQTAIHLLTLQLNS